VSACGHLEALLSVSSRYFLIANERLPEVPPLIFLLVEKKGNFSEPQNAQKTKLLTRPPEAVSAALALEAVRDFPFYFRLKSSEKKGKCMPPPFVCGTKENPPPEGLREDVSLGLISLLCALRVCNETPVDKFAVSICRPTINNSRPRPQVAAAPN
jgi:hypothetical protein